jgi:hypothetical protein
VPLRYITLLLPVVVVLEDQAGIMVKVALEVPEDLL